MNRRRSLAGVIAAMAVVNLVYGITFPLLALVLNEQGVSKTLIGISTVVQAAAVIVIAPWAPRLMSAISPARLMQLMTVLLAVLFVVAGWYPDVWFWFPLRFLIGAASALLWIASEALINELAEESWRGRIIGLYAAVGAAGFAMGPLLLIATGSAGLLPFLVTSLLILVAGLPLFLVQAMRLDQHEEDATGLWKIFWLAPTVMVANVVYAAAVESLLTFFPLFGLGLGLSEHVSLWLMTLVGLGGMMLVLPIGWLADHVNRMGLLLACTLLTMIGLLCMPRLVQVPLVADAYAFVFGGIESMIYALGVILVGQQFRGAMLAAATTLFTACWGVGTIIGPLVVGIGMDRLGSASMPLVIFAFYLVFLPLPLISLWRQRATGVRDTGAE